jgi:hypothetical protein
MGLTTLHCRGDVPGGAPLSSSRCPEPFGFRAFFEPRVKVGYELSDRTRVTNEY